MKLGFILFYFVPVQSLVQVLSDSSSFSSLSSASFSSESESQLKFEALLLILPRVCFCFCFCFFCPGFINFLLFHSSSASSSISAEKSESVESWSFCDCFYTHRNDRSLLLFPHLVFFCSSGIDFIRFFFFFFFFFVFRWVNLNSKWGFVAMVCASHSSWFSIFFGLLLTHPRRVNKWKFEAPVPTPAQPFFFCASVFLVHKNSFFHYSYVLLTPRSSGSLFQSPLNLKA